MTLDIYYMQGDFDIIDVEYVRQVKKIFSPTLLVDTEIVVGTHDIVIDYTDSNGIKKQELTTIIATDKCLTAGL